MMILCKVSHTRISCFSWLHPWRSQMFDIFHLRWTCLTWLLSWGQTSASSMCRYNNQYPFLPTCKFQLVQCGVKSGPFAVDGGGFPGTHRDVLPHPQHWQGHLLAGGSSRIAAPSLRLGMSSALPTLSLSSTPSMSTPGNSMSAVPSTWLSLGWVTWLAKALMGSLSQKKEAHLDMIEGVVVDCLNAKWRAFIGARLTPIMFLPDAM